VLDYADPLDTPGLAVAFGALDRGEHQGVGDGLEPAQIG
jgi:hypothetical protein